jgi:hypothetical protein
MRDIEFYNPPSQTIHTHSETLVEVRTLPRRTYLIMTAGVIGFILSILELIAHGL